MNFKHFIDFNIKMFITF